jgi:hypothetical protein
MSRRRSIMWPSPGPFERLSLAGIWLDCVASLCSFLETDSTQARLRSATQAAIVSIGWRLRCHRAMHSAAWARRARAARGDRRSRRGVGCTPPHARSRVASAVRSSVVSKTGLSRVRSGRSQTAQSACGVALHRAARSRPRVGRRVPRLTAGCSELVHG